MLLLVLVFHHSKRKDFNTEKNIKDYVWVQIQAPFLPGYVIFGKMLNFFESWFAHLQRKQWLYLSCVRKRTIGNNLCVHSTVFNKYFLLFSNVHSEPRFTAYHRLRGRYSVFSKNLWATKKDRQQLDKSRTVSAVLWRKCKGWRAEKRNFSPNRWRNVQK